MSKVNAIKKIIKKEELNLKSNQNYNELKTFLRKAEEAGLAIKKEYSLPQTDTIGKKYYDSIKYKKNE